MEKPVISRQLIFQFKKSLKGDVLFLGMGNLLRSDDGAGIFLLKKLKHASLINNPHCDFLNVGMSPENYLEKILQKNFCNLIIFDAVEMGQPPGTIKKLDLRRLSGFALSTHCPSPVIFLDFLKKQKKFSLHFFAIQPKSLDFSEHLSHEVISSINAFVEQLRN
jgi:hydrogenase 3 maturation protease